MQNVLITSAGSWKLAGFGFAISAAQAGNLDNMQSFHYSVSLKFANVTSLWYIYFVVFNCIR